MFRYLANFIIRLKKYWFLSFEERWILWRKTFLGRWSKSGNWSKKGISVKTTVMLILSRKSQSSGNLMAIRWEGRNLRTPWASTMQYASLLDLPGRPSLNYVVMSMCNTLKCACVIQEDFLQSFWPSGMRSIHQFSLLVPNYDNKLIYKTFFTRKGKY